jgi:23S rRNA (uridine2552-2'-O)-methyltransferase
MADYKKLRNPWVSDYWQQKARKEGYPARSVYKLKEIDEKFGLLKIQRQRDHIFRVLDIGAAPGSWSLYVLRKMVATGIKSLLVAADLSPFSHEFDNDVNNRGLFDNNNFYFIQGDITTTPVCESILSKGPYSVIISDVAPNTTGNHMIDSIRSLELVEAVLEYAQKTLTQGGNLAVKIFQGSGTETLLKRMRTLFKTTKCFKPEACRGESVETYFIGMGFL